MPPEPGRRWVLIGGGAFALALLLYLLLVGRGTETAPVIAPAPAPPPPVPAAPPPPAAPTPAAMPEGLRLHGVTGAGAIIGMADGSQRLVMVGRAVLPGILLQSIAVDHVILQSGATQYRLDFSGVSTAGGTGPATPSATAPGPDGPPSEAGVRADVLRYRLGLAPRQVGGRITSHIVRPNQDMPFLQQAGLRPGDVILRVNDSEFDQERMLDLAWTIHNSDEVVFEIERNGRPMRLVGRGRPAR